MNIMNTQERILPDRFSLIIENHLGLVYGTDTEAIFFRPKQYKSRTWGYRFQSKERRDQKIEETFKYLQDREDRKKTYKEEKRSELDGIQVGDIFYNSWGWEQTNIDFYQVIAKTRGTFTIQQIKGKREWQGDMHGTTFPVPNEFVDDSEPQVKRSTNMQFGMLHKVENGKKYDFSTWA